MGVGTGVPPSDHPPEKMADGWVGSSLLCFMTFLDAGGQMLPAATARSTLYHAGTGLGNAENGTDGILGNAESLVLWFWSAHLLDASARLQRRLGASLPLGDTAGGWW